MPVPKRKRSRARRDKRFANKAIKPKAIIACQTCRAPVMPHIVCSGCGYYKGVKVLRTKIDRMQSRGEAFQARHAAIQAQAIHENSQQTSTEPVSE